MIRDLACFYKIEFIFSDFLDSVLVCRLEATGGFRALFVACFGPFFDNFFGAGLTGLWSTKLKIGSISSSSSD